MRIALYGHFMFHLAVGLREIAEHDVQLFLDSNTVPNCLLDEPMLYDSSFVHRAPWVTHREILQPKRAELTKQLSRFDVAITTDLGPVFAAAAEIDYVIIPSGSDLTQWPFPIRSRAIRSRGKADIIEVMIALRLRSAIRAASEIWGEGFSRYSEPLARLGCRIGGYLHWPIDTETFAPEPEPSRKVSDPECITIFHPTRMMFTPDPFLIESMGWKRNDLLLRGFAMALEKGVNARLVLVARAGSPDEDKARRLLEGLGVGDQVDWRTPENPEGYTWREIADLYRSSDLVVDEFGGCLGLVALEGASCGKPVLNYLDSTHGDGVVESLYPGGHPFLQAQSAEEVCNVIMELTDHELRTSIGRASRQWVMDHHERSLVARRCESMLEELLAS